jgi:hypothetical protein
MSEVSPAATAVGAHHDLARGWHRRRDPPQGPDVRGRRHRRGDRDLRGPPLRRTRSAATGSRDAGPALAEATPSTTAPVLNAIAPSESTTAPIVRADEVARALEARLDKQRLWSTVQVIGDHVEVRSATCSDSGMRLAIDQSAAQFHAAGLTRLSCLEQSGGVVFIRAF